MTPTHVRCIDPPAGSSFTAGNIYRIINTRERNSEVLIEASILLDDNKSWSAHWMYKTQFRYIHPSVKNPLTADDIKPEQ